MVLPMTLDRGTLARIDRAILAALDHDRVTQLVKVPVSEATWSTWRRYCDAIGIPMGGAIAALVEHELRSVVADLDDGPVFLTELKAEIEKRRRALNAREHGLEIREQRLRALSAGRQSQPSPHASSGSKVGRNQPCPCGSSLKYKRCHGR